jgi:hypothetical protein
MPQRKRGGTFAALGQAASNIIVPAGFYYAAKYQRSRMSKKHRKHGRKTYRR